MKTSLTDSFYADQELNGLLSNQTTTNAKTRKANDFPGFIWRSGRDSKKLTIYLNIKSLYFLHLCQVKHH